MNYPINNMYGNPYNYPYQNSFNQPQNTLNNQSQSLIRVNGLEGAKAYQMQPNGISALFDSNEDIFYLKFQTVQASRTSENLLLRRFLIPFQHNKLAQTL